MKTWLVTDRHHNHKKIVELEARPADWEHRLLENWRRLVKPDDIVIDLGDVILGQVATIGDINAALPGKKILVMGNHDYHHKPAWWLTMGYALVVQSLVMENIFLTHVPASTLPGNALLNVHGHLHGNRHREGGNETWHKLLAIENTNYCPVEFEEFAEVNKRSGILVLM